jgi:hypothetical protein
MLVDLVNGPFNGKRFSLHKTDPATGLKHRVTLGDDVGSPTGQS